MARPVEAQGTLLLFLVQVSSDMQAPGDTKGQGTVWTLVLEETLNVRLAKGTVALPGAGWGCKPGPEVGVRGAALLNRTSSR